MPNHITNILTIESSDEVRVKEILESICYDGKLGTFDFEKVIPIPENIYRGNLGAKEYAQYGANNWYDFCIKSWSTKWNSYAYEYFDEYEAGSNTIKFFTAWSAPHKVFEKLSCMFPDVEIKYKCRGLASVLEKAHSYAVLMYKIRGVANSGGILLK